METVTLQLWIGTAVDGERGATIYPTVTVRAKDWRRAKEQLAAGERPTLIGSAGGCGCRGERLSGGLDQVTLIAGPDECGGYEVESEIWKDWGFTENNCIRLYEH